MRPRVHVPFDAWAMPVEVSVSQLIRVGDLAWSCGRDAMLSVLRERFGDLPLIVPIEVLAVA